MGFLEDVEKRLDLPTAQKRQVMNELTSHFEDLKEELAASGMTQCEAEQEAEKRMGEPADVAQRITAVQCTATWRSALLTGLPFILVALAKLLMEGYMSGYRLSSKGEMNALMFNAGLVFLLVCLPVFIGSVRELKAGRRPIWLPTWVAPALFGLVQLFSALILKAHVAEMSIWLFWAMEVIVVGGITAYLYRQSRKARLIAVSGVALLVPCLYFTLTGGSIVPLLVYLGLLQIPVVTTFAVKVFARHPYGSLVQASMFLYSFYVSMLPMNPPPSMVGPTVMLLVRSFILAAGVIACVRICQVTGKISALCLGVFAAVLISNIPALSGHEDGILGLMPVISTTLVVILLITLPSMLSHKFSHTQRLKVAR